MKYFRSQNLNPGQIRDHSVWRKANGDIELNPANDVIINGNLIIDGNVPGPEVTNILYVTLDGNDANTGRGEGPDQAKRTLKSALAVAQQGTTIIVRSGEYYEDNPLKVPPHVTILGDSLRNTIIKPLNGPDIYTISSIERTDNITTITLSAPHSLVIGDRIRVRCSNDAVDETDVNITSVTSNTVSYRQAGTNVPAAIATGRVLYGKDMFHVNSKVYIAQLVIKSLRAPAYCVSIDSDAIVDTSPYVQNCSNISGPFMNNGTEWLPFVTEQPDLNGVMVTGPRPLLDHEIDPTQVANYGIDNEGSGGGMLIDGDKYSSESPIKSMVADAFTQVTQGGVGFHITNFGYMQLVSCFAVFCSKAFYTTRGGYLSISNSVIDFGTEGFTADGYYLDPYADGDVEQDYYSTVGSISVTVEGEGYLSTPIAIIDPPTTPGGVQATATVNVDPITKRINAIIVDNPGSGYDFVPNVTITGGSPSVNGEGLVNLSKNSTITVSGLPNKPQIGSIMFLGNDPTAYYISDTVGSIAPFDYDEVKCRRDSGIILDGIYYDVALGTNYNAVINGMSYRRGMASEVIDNQLVQTVGALNYLKTQAATILSNATAVSRNNAAVAEIIDIIENGTSAADALVFPTPVGVDTNRKNAFDQLVNNKSFIVAEITAWIADQVAGNIAPFTTLFTYDEVTCARDVGYIVDALCYDMLYGGNSATKTAAQAYFEGAVSVLPTGQVAPTAAAFNRLSLIIQDIVQEIAVTPSTTNVLTQNFLADPAGALQASELDTLVQIIEDVITAGSTLGLPATVNPSITWADPLLQSAVTSLAANKTTIVNNVISFINTEYATVFTYDQQKCRRDVRIILNAVLTDSIFGSNYQSYSAGIAYLRSYSSKVLSTQKSQTLAALEQAKTSTLALTSNATMLSRIASNFDIVINIIDNGLSGVPGTINMPAPSGARSGFPEAAAILDANRTFIQSELTAWIAENYPLLSYDSVTCQRDISYIIDAMRYDFIYGGNTQTTNAALAYVEGSVIRGEVEETIETYRYWQTIVGQIVRNEVIDRTTGNTVTQDITISVGTPVPAPNSPSDVAEELLEIVIKELDHGPGYIPDPVTLPSYNTADPTLAAERVTIYNQTISIQDAVIDYLQNAYGGSIDVYVFPPIMSVETGTQVRFHNVSTISTASTAMEYVGAGVTYNALPFFGGEPIPANERVEINQGKCFTVTSDQIGNYRIGEFFTVNALTGAVTIDAENLNLSGLAAIGPFKRNGIPVGVQLREVSDNINLISSTGARDGNTAPTQNAVATYVENRYLNKVASTAQTVVSDVNFDGDVSVDGDLEVKGGDLTTDQTTFNLVDTTATTVNFAGDATTIDIGASSGTTTVKNDFKVDNNAELGSSTTDVHTVNGSLDILSGPLLVQDQDGLEILSGLTGAGATIQTVGVSTTPDLYIKSKSLDISTGTTPTQQVVISDTGVVTLFSNTTSTNYSTGSLVVVGGIGVSGDFNIQGAQNIGGNLDVGGTIISTSQTSFDLLNTTVASVNFAQSATAIDIGNTSGTTTINHDLAVNGNTTLGDSTDDLVTINGRLSLSLKDNVPSAFELSEGLNSYFKLATTDGNELITFGSVPKLSILNTVDASSTTVASVTFSGGLGIAKKLFVGTDLTVEGSTTLGNEVSTDTVDVTGQVDILIPDNVVSPFNIREGLSDYLTAVTTDGNESITIGSAPKLKVLNVTDSTNKDTGALIVEGGAGIEKNLTVGVDLTVDRDATVTRDLAVNGGDLTTTATTFNLINANATTVNFAGSATAIEIGSATGTTSINHNVDIDGDLNVDGGDLTTNQTAFNLINTNATDVNFARDATTLHIADTTGDTYIHNNLTVDIDLAVNGGDLTTTATTFNLVDTTATTVNFARAGTAITIGATTGTATIRNANTVVTGDLAVNGGDLTTTATTFNLINSTATTVNFAGAATTLEIGAATGTTNINNDLDVDGDVNIDGGDLTVSTATFNLANTTATTVNFAGAATDVQIGASTGSTNVNNNLIVDGDVEVKGGDLTTDQTTFNLLNTTATTVNFAGAATTLEIGAATGTTNINNNLDVDGNVNIDGGDLTVSTSTFNLANTTATTVNFAGAATTIEIGSATGTTNINNNLVVDGDLEVKGGDLTTDQTTFNLVNTSATTVNAFGVATAVNIAASAASASTLTFGAQLSSNAFRLASTVDGSGTVHLTSDVTTGIVNVYADLTTGTINIGTGGASTVNIGGTGSTVNIKTLTLDTDLEVQYGGTGVGTFTTNGVIFGNGTGSLQVTAASDPGVGNATTSYGILTTDASNVPVWTDTIDGGSY